MDYPSASSETFKYQIIDLRSGSPSGLPDRKSYNYEEIFIVYGGCFPAGFCGMRDY